ncbi:class I SAM-dependent methyltransferase [Alcaligenes endophyticus]|uniref:Class I SAM-dependent methyltransferase n=1 Tax=Alcaligenes endophyticus TaxID=1929088 RepID=A0ABT8EHV6_9BURK|nr:class I SAM-dependent methyltransferase [Alcaligenes endophyticus]MCX5592686.1 class I SAM-dependent methyltransferase [Alcaligenes endophyticus]MDN4120874.1 class I SAM-dependent methyltransferase [Alcaligenes endophyticus]
MSSISSALQAKLEQLSVPTQVTLPSGETVGSSDARVHLIIKDNATLAQLAAGQSGLLGQAYVEGGLDFEGSMRDLMQLASDVLPGSPVEAARAGWLTSLIAHLTSVWRHTQQKDAEQIRFHYDLSDDFYALWLDPKRVYSCAYYREPEMNLAQAQEAKLDLLCRKLRLQSGDRFLDVGAGWGGLLIWAAEHYDVHVTGITLSENQHAYVNRLIIDKGLQGRARMELMDYRDLDEHQAYDKLASVGMFEHVGRAQLSAYFAKLGRLVRPGGLILNHGITSGGVDNPQLGAGMGDFIEKYIFPGGELTHISHVLRHLAEGGLEELDVENLRPHYARTLWAWSDALEEKLAEAAATLNSEQGMKSLRAYRVYLAGCAMGFEHGWIALHQVLAQPQVAGRKDELDYPSDLSYPWRRDYIYRGSA